MSKYTLHHQIADGTEGLTDGRDVRALIEDMDVTQTDDDRFDVRSASGARYTVSLRRGECSCPDADRGNHCKHLRRVSFLTGARPLPDVADALAEYGLEITIDAAGVEGEPRTVAAMHADARTATPAVADGGEDHTHDATSTAESDDAPICGSTNTKSGDPCKFAAGECPHEHHRSSEDEDEDEELAETDGVTSIGLAVADGGEGEPQAFEARVERVVRSAVEAANDGATVVVVVND